MTARPPEAYIVDRRPDDEDLQARVHLFTTLAGGNMNSKATQRTLFTSATLAGVLAFSFAVAADTLEGSAARNLLSGHTMVSKHLAGSNVSYWSWNTDGTVCLRLFDKKGQCSDTGRWSIDHDHVCYELTWYGKELGLYSNCFRVAKVGAGAYEAREDNGMPLWQFTVIK